MPTPGKLFSILSLTFFNDIEPRHGRFIAKALLRKFTFPAFRGEIGAQKLGKVFVLPVQQLGSEFEFAGKPCTYCCLTTGSVSAGHLIQGADTGSCEVCEVGLFFLRRRLHPYFQLVHLITLSVILC